MEDAKAYMEDFTIDDEKYGLISRHNVSRAKHNILL